MSKTLRDVTISASDSWPDRRQFNVRTRFLTTLFLDGLPKCLFPFGKIIISLEPATPKLEFEPMLNVLRLNMEFDFDKFLAKKKEKQTEMLFNILSLGLRISFVHFGADMQPLEVALGYVQERKFINQGYLKKKAESPDKKKYAKIFFRFTEESIELSFHIFQKPGQQSIREIFAATIPPHEVYFYPAIGEFVWSADGNITLFSRTRDKKIVQHAGI